MKAKPQSQVGITLNRVARECGRQPFISYQLEDVTRSAGFILIRCDSQGFALPRFTLGFMLAARLRGLKSELHFCASVWAVTNFQNRVRIRQPAASLRSA